MKKIILVILLIGTISFLTGCKAKEEETVADDISLSAQPKQELVEAYGVIKASAVKDIMIEFPASVEQVNVKNGQKVSSGDTLMVLNIDDFEAQLTQQECDLAIQKSQENLIKEQENKLTASEANLALQRGKLDTANVKQNEVISDIDHGIIYNIGSLAGDMVYSGYKLATIADLDSLIVNADIDQQFIAWVKEGAKVDIIPEYDKSQVIQGTVSFISSKAFMNNGETVVPVEITISGDTQGLILDADVQVKIYPTKQE